MLGQWIFHTSCCKLQGNMASNLRLLKGTLVCILEEVGILMIPLHFITSFSIILNGIKSVRFINSLHREKERKKKREIRNGVLENQYTYWIKCPRKRN